MTSLTSWVRHARVRRVTTGIVLGSLACALAGCQGDRANNADSKKPIAVTASGVEIMEVTRSQDRRIVEAVVVAGGEERQVTFEPFLDGPLPLGMAAKLGPENGAQVEMDFGWDSASGATWVRHVDGNNTFEFVRTNVPGRIIEEYTFNGQFLRLEYADLPTAIREKATEKFLRGEPLLGVSPDVSEFVGALQAYEDFAAQIPVDLVTGGSDGILLTSLLDDAVFAGVISDGAITPNRPDGLCLSFNVCMAISCRLYPNPQLCAVCTAGTLACLFMDWFCHFWCGD